MSENPAQSNADVAQDTIQKAKSFGIASLVLGIIALLLCFSGPGALLGLACGIVGLVLGSKARKRLPVTDRGMATAGYVCSIVSICLCAAGFIISIGFLGTIGGLIMMK